MYTSVGNVEPSSVGTSPARRKVSFSRGDRGGNWKKASSGRSPLATGGAFSGWCSSSIPVRPLPFDLRVFSVLLPKPTMLNERQLFGHDGDLITLVLKGETHGTSTAHARESDRKVNLPIRTTHVRPPLILDSIAIYCQRTKHRGVPIGNPFSFRDLAICS